MAKKGSVLVVDDEEIMRDVLESLLSPEGYRVDLAKTGEGGLDAYTKRPYDVVLLDVSMPGIGGLRALEEFLKLDTDAVVVMITAYATFDTAIAAWEKGAFGCIRKPFQNELISTTVAAGIKRRRKDEERRSLRRAMSREVDRGAIVGRSDIMQEVFRLVEQVAPARSTILFTGAVAAKKGLFEVADGGSIFLDEIGDIPPETQVRLLRVIQEREFTPLGDTTPRRVDVRIIAATNIDLREAVRQGSFREDLYYRLAVVPIELPPLRDRREDVLPLAQHFIGKYNEENGRHVSEQIAPEVLALLEAYSWPGNVRELENAIERAVVIAPGNEVSRQCLRPEISDPESVIVASQEGASVGAVQDLGRGINFYDQVRRFEIDLIRRALEQTGGHQSRAARLLGMNATTLNSKIKTYRISLRP